MSFHQPIRFFVLVTLICFQVGFIASAWAADGQASNASFRLGIPTLPPLPNTISGVVTSEKTGAAIERATVTLYRQNGTKWRKETSTRTNANGQYQFTNRAPGIFRIQFKATKYKTEYFDNAATLQKATNLVLAAGGALNNRNAALAAR